MPQRPQVGIGVLITKDDQVLLMKRSRAHGEGTWSPVGGHLEYGETVEECAKRETLEEIGIHLAEVTFLAFTNDVFEASAIHYVTVWLTGQYVSGTPAMRAEREMSALDWFPWNALPEPLFLPFEHLLAGKCYPALWDLDGREDEQAGGK